MSSSSGFPIQKNVTIIHPAFNHADLVCRAVASVKATVDPRHRVLIADDHSTEEGFERRVKAEIAGAPNFRYVRSSRNLGFVATCNQSAALADAGTDILLLNSDAVLTAGAVEEMIGCLAASDRHGVVCPRSNAATLLTIPQLHAPAEDLRSRSFACWQRLSPRLPRFSVTPTGVGFCMLIRRDLIGRFGLFDDVYGRGYNEENDFCMRIARYGFSTVMANHAYVFHDEGGSFTSAERARLEAKNRRTLLSRYPEYARAVDEYFRRLPAHEHFADILGRFDSRPKILLDLSGLIPAFNGTSEYALSLVPLLLPLLERDADVSVLVSRKADTFFDIASRFPRVLITEDKPAERFDLAFVPQQVFAMDHLERLNRMAVRWLVSMQDVIALRCPAIRQQGSPDIVRMVTRFADGILSVSRSSLEDFRAWLQVPLRPEVITAAVHHAYPVPDTERRGEERELPDAGFVFVVGNHYDHKAVKEAVECLPSDRPVIVLGDRVHANVCRKHGARLIESGRLSQRVVDELYTRAAVVVFPSQYEGFGLPLLHAAAAGTHTVAFDSAVTREIVDAFGLKALVTLCPDFRSMGAAAGLHRSGKHPVPTEKRSWSDVAAETAGVIKSVLEQPVDDTELRSRFEVFAAMDTVKRKTVRDCYSPRGLLHLLSRRIRKIFSSCTGSFFG